MLYNFTEGKEVNPLTNVTHFVVNSMAAKNTFEKFICNKDINVAAVFSDGGDGWEIAYPINVLRVTAPVRWYDGKRGCFIYKGKRVEFVVDGQLMIL